MAFPGDRSFSEMSSAIFRIELLWIDGGWCGTAFKIAMFDQSKRLVLATAKHVLEFPKDQPIHWKVEQFDEYGNAVRGVSFLTNSKNAESVPYFTHNSLDVGVIILPELGNDGQRFGRDDETPIRVIDIRSAVTTGTRVAWAGFPGIVEQVLRFPQLCYFEGVVSAKVDRGDFQIYIVDGHASHGVSGGPVWYWSEKHERLEVVSIVCSYKPLGKGLPGFCLFERHNPIRS